MPKCKFCGEIVGVLEIKDGYCSECYDPKVREEKRKKLEEEKLKQKSK